VEGKCALASARVGLGETGTSGDLAGGRGAVVEVVPLDRLDQADARDLDQFVERFGAVAESARERASGKCASTNSSRKRRSRLRRYAENFSSISSLDTPADITESSTASQGVETPNRWWASAPRD
jgi:hypothetical protein